jgi:hypothetical protein
MANEIEKVKARDILSESAHNFLTSKITLPLGNPDLKKVHTNQFLWTELPDEFLLENWETLAEAYQGRETRYQGSNESGYTVNRWYIESVDINVDASGKAEMQLGLNAFPSSNKEYTDGYQAMVKAYNDTFNKQTTNSSNGGTSSGKKTTNATKKTNTAYFKSKAGKNVSSDVKKAAAQITKDCNTEEQRAYCIYYWVDDYVTYEKYWNSKYTSSQVLKGHKANCYDTAFLIYNLCSACKPKVRCEIYNGTYHFLDETIGHVWNKIPYKGKMTFADTGRTPKNPIGNHGSGRYIDSGGGSPWKKNY